MGGGVEQTQRRRGTLESLHGPGRGREREGVRGWEGEKGCPVGAGQGALGLARASNAERADRAGGAGVRAGARREGPRQASACMCCGAGGAVKELHTSLVPANDIGVLPSHGRSACGTRTCADQDMKRMKSNKNIRAGECISRSKRSSGSKLSPEWNASAQNLIFSENMMEVTRLESFLHENKLIPLVEAHKT